MDSPRLHISNRLRQMMSYDKLSGEVPRILILRGEYWLDGACDAAAREMGWQVESVPIVMEGALSRDQIARLLEALVQLKPDFILSINLSGMDCDGLLARLFEDLEVPYVAWFVDDPRTIIMGKTIYATSNAVALTWDSTYRDYLSGVGFPYVETLPLAADISLFNSDTSTDWSNAPAFVGNSMEAYAERAWEPISTQTELAETVQSAFRSGVVTRDNFGAGLSAMLPHDVLARLDDEAQRHAEMYLFIEGTRRLRRTVVTALAEEGLVVHGDEGWKRSVPMAGGPVPYAQSLPAFYRECELNLNITSIQMPSAVNQRVFDCPAAGGFLLTDYQSSLNELFDVEREVATYTSLADCLEKFRWFRAHPLARIEIATRARGRILRDHTYAHRLKTIVHWVMKRFG